MHCRDLGKSFPTHIFVQNLASIQPRTNPVKFARSRTTAGFVRAAARSAADAPRASTGASTHAGRGPCAGLRRSGISDTTGSFFSGSQLSRYFSFQTLANKNLSNFIDIFGSNAVRKEVAQGSSYFSPFTSFPLQHSPSFNR